jgi:hypothetical protein
MIDPWVYKNAKQSFANGIRICMGIIRLAKIQGKSSIIFMDGAA